MADWTIKPGKEIDDEDLRKMASLGATYEELADHYQTTPTWLYNNKKQIIDAGKSATKLKLRQEQMKIAFNPSHPKQVTMLIFLGKAMLDQREITEVITSDKTFNIEFTDEIQNT